MHRPDLFHRRGDRISLLHFAQEEAVKRKTFRLIAVLVSVIAAGLPMTLVFATKGAAQSPQTQARGVPVFEVDPAWPKLPQQFKLGDASSFAIDAQDNVWLLHRPRTLKPEDAGRRRPRSSCLMPPATSSRLGAGRAADMTGPSASTASISTTRALCGSGGTIVRPRASPNSGRSPMTCT